MNRSLLLLVVWIFSTSLYSQVKTYETLTWQDIESQIYRHETVQQALIVKNVKAAQYATEAGWKGLKINVNPSLQYSDPEGTLAYTQSAVGAELSFPLGITQEEKEKKIQAFEALDLSDKELRASYGQAYLELFSLFTSAFLAQESVTVAEAELELYRLKASVTRQKVSQGLAPVSDQTDAESEFQAAAEKLIQTRLDLRLAWLNLAYAANLPISRMGMMGGQSSSGDPVGSVPRFEGLDVSAFLKEVPQPGRLMTAAKSNSPIILAQQQKLEKAKRAITYQATTNFDFLPKFTYATPDNSVSLGFNTQSGSVTLGSSWTLYKNEKLSSGGSQPPDHSFTIFLGISASLSGEGEKEKQALQEAALLEEKRLLSLQQSLDLLIRSKYASYLKARDSVAEAERMVEAAKSDSEVLQTRSRIGQISPEDEAAHRVLMERTTFNLKKARLNLAQAYLSMIQTANAWDLIGRPLENKQ